MRGRRRRLRAIPGGHRLVVVVAVGAARLARVVEELGAAVRRLVRHLRLNAAAPSAAARHATATATATAAATRAAATAAPH